MLKLALVLGCLLSLALARPNDMEHKRLARSSSSESNSGESTTTTTATTTTQAGATTTPNIASLIQLLLRLLSGN
ncbi:hypothetical protein CesoFtcFv8_009076 [Champsocephalus esox]|uniref:Uncharacterized protein n=2 Tax=Champsocephalus TaxID=52236 RepID=A0AAN8DWG7_CHAGU|nr:hypothetical protein CesoFtcFv8_009076 [Champsocephalus esox]KAK5926729.1 hypothetical protein CgunFtcFv8_022276 [Champsocephalus gunnari]KAK5926730.1 hypothetical protein CgunFtcFv8_022277 [Champsocephalus gunnari]